MAWSGTQPLVTPLVTPMATHGPMVTHGPMATHGRSGPATRRTIRGFCRPAPGAIVVRAGTTSRQRRALHVIVSRTAGSPGAGCPDRGERAGTLEWRGPCPA